ncbi:hypothetical protein [Dyadobacter sandarakinus]|uniref:Lipoprotein n=1 Tax=Dyadobacter sandarakinus TaxID=2747268 RepID=A0ABX7I5D2_9BACT|nr:hypothetical protein [Dyadobacter sandarakinus]QRR01000.1 hypothetical protein HWI92_08850 [Dyadobacter sandarakinus]
MKKIVLLAAMAICAIACEKEDQVVQQAEYQTTSVPYRTRTAVAVPGADLKVDLKDVSDSRCPKNVVCIQAGDAKLLFDVSEGSNEAEVVVNFKGDAKTDSQTFVLGAQKYLLKVSSVLPYPETSQSPRLDDYKVQLAIEKL